ncbi:hypothetical protein AB0C52_34435 [Streptomyces sp. NPDC048717]|uniref:hypothetical protein n=1 Tax=Streptomyces sp. NPDC048717 TaxID=3154928 RepID=UPI00341E03FE
MKLRRALPIATLLPLLLTLSACGGESKNSGEGDQKTRASTQSTAAGAEGKAEAEAKRIGAVGPKALEKAALTGQRNGFMAKKVAKAQVEAGRDMKADKAECQPLASLAGGYTHLPAVSVEHRSLDAVDAKNATVGSMWLASHSEKDARRVMADLRNSLKECPKGFKTLGLAYTDIQSVAAPKLGDEAVGYRITSVVGDQKVPMTYTVVRDGGVIAAFYGVNMLTPKNSAIPEAVVKAQLDQLG